MEPRLRYKGFVAADLCWTPGDARWRMRKLLFRACGLLLSTIAVCAGAQTQAPAPPPYTMHVNSRVVLTDVLVTDKNGNPVHGLPETAFGIFDNGQPQRISSFTEHTGEENPPAEQADNTLVHTNAYLRHPPPALDAILIDITTIHIVDQMYLADQLHRFVNGLPPGALLAVYARVGDYAVPLQDFTSNHTLLNAAVSKAIPRLQQPGSWAATDIETLDQMVRLLARFPGRKDLIWFSGGSSLALMIDAGEVPMVNMRPLYDELERTRVAVYPVDARGLTTWNSGGQMYQHMMMQEAADATGGHAFFNNNGLKDIASRIVGSSSDFYTLTYSPERVKFDNKWHKVSVKVEGQHYRLSYRRGYFDDGSNVEVPPPGARQRLSADGTRLPGPPEPLAAQIIFSASIAPGPDLPPGVAPPPVGPANLPVRKKGDTTYEIRYTLPANAFTQQASAAGPQLLIGTGVLGVNTLGEMVARQVSAERVILDPDKWRADPNGNVSFQQSINLPRGDDLLTVLVWDGATGRFGVVQMPVTVPKHGR
jgi:VWFA-related protein